MKKSNISLLFSVFILHALFLFLLSFMGASFTAPLRPTRVEITMIEEKPLNISEMEKERVEIMTSAPPVAVELPPLVQAEENISSAEEQVQEQPEEEIVPPQLLLEKPKVEEIKKEPPKVVKKPEVNKAPSKPAIKKNPVSKKPLQKQPIVKKTPSSNLKAKTPTPAPSSEERKRQEKLLSMMRSSIDSLKSSQNKTANSPSQGFFAKEISPLKCEKLSITVGGTSSFANELAIYLKHKLTLPEAGQVKLKLTLFENGHVKDLIILSSTSAKNQSYVEKTIQGLTFPSLPSHQSDTFLLTLKGD